MTTSPVVVRLARESTGALLQSCDVYIGHAWSRNGWNLPQSKWANPFLNDLQTYENHVRATLAASLPELGGRVLGCWCRQPEEAAACHGTTLVRLWREQNPGFQVDPDLGKRLNSSANGGTPLEEPHRVAKVRVKRATPYTTATKHRVKPEKKFHNQTTSPEGIRHNGQNVPWPAMQHEWNPDTIWIDEAGMGSWAGPLYVAGTVIVPGFSVQGIHDSKLLKDHELERVYEDLQAAVRQGTLLTHIAIIPPDEIDRLKLAGAWKLAIRQIISALKLTATQAGIRVTRVVLDGNKNVDQTEIPVTPVTFADRLYAGVAAASVLAKVGRDRHMSQIADKYPEFKTIFAEGHGYGHSKLHRDLLEAGKHTDIHRKSFNPLRSVLAGRVKIVKSAPTQHEDGSVFRLVLQAPETSQPATSAADSDNGGLGET